MFVRVLLSFLFFSAWIGVFGLRVFICVSFQTEMVYCSRTGNFNIKPNGRLWSIKTPDLVEVLGGGDISAFGGTSNLWNKYRPPLARCVIMSTCHKTDPCSHIFPPLRRRCLKKPEVYKSEKKKCLEATGICAFGHINWSFVLYFSQEPSYCAGGVIEKRSVQ